HVTLTAVLTLVVENTVEDYVERNDGAVDVIAVRVAVVFRVSTRDRWPHATGRVVAWNDRPRVVDSLGTDGLGGRIFPGNLDLLRVVVRLQCLRRKDKVEVRLMGLGA